MPVASSRGRASRAAATLLTALALGACGSEPVAPTETGNSASAGPIENVAELTGARFSYGATGACTRLTGDGAQYLLVPQFASGGGNEGPRKTSYFIGNENPTTTTVSLEGASARLVGGWTAAPGGPRRSWQQRFDGWLRAREHELAPQAAEVGRELRAERAVAGARIEAAATFPALRTFKTLNNIDGTSFSTVTAALRYVGQNIVIYQDTAAPANGFSDSELQSFGNLFDQTLYPIDTAAFGPPSDIDANGKVIVLMTPKVNALVSAASCTQDQSFVTGYFFGFDLGSRDSTRSNRGEVFYTFTPDPTGRYSCAHSVQDVERIVPATFIHELQHMISFGAHVLRRGGADEEVWLNEGLSIVAEELGSLHYEAKYPPGTCGPGIRTDCSQLFPDSSQGYIVGNLTYAFGYLADAPDTSITTFESTGTLAERGGVWLFLRWLGDHKGDAVFRALEETKLTGITNVTAAAGEPFPGLFADFGISTYTDSLPGLPRDAVPVRWRFVSRNLRQLYARLAAIHVVGPDYPVQPKPLAAAGGEQGAMVQGTMDWYILTTPAGATPVPLHLVRSDHRALPSSLVPQIGVFRLPTP